MPKYYFNVHGVSPSVDDVGEDLLNDEAAWSQATVMAGDLFKDIDGNFRPGKQWTLEGNRRGDEAAIFHRRCFPKGEVMAGRYSWYADRRDTRPYSDPATEAHWPDARPYRTPNADHAINTGHMSGTGQMLLLIFGQMTALSRSADDDQAQK